ncbi:MAG: glycosyltransferase [Chloroflexota bacterium]|nr:glycosyltransferase [Chloroflexota bacterium]
MKPASSAARPDLVCVSHLTWDWVWQRPQQLLARLSRHYPVLYVEEPWIRIGPPSDELTVREVEPNLRVARLELCSDPDTFWRRLDETRDRDGFHPSEVSRDIEAATLMFESRFQPRLEDEVGRYVAGWRRKDAPLVLWLYTPMVVRFVDLLGPDLVVYDAMDELSSFRSAPPRLAELERDLLARADLVFAGTPSVYERKTSRHPDVHLFPSGVEPADFAPARDARLPPPRELQGAPRPVVGYCGVIDERSDLDLLASVADLRPDWTWVLVGPVIKIEERALPRRRNIVYAGKKRYDELPQYLAAFDVTMIPFAMNDATRYLLPTKTLEYMAAGKPVVSTPVPDVVASFGSVVRIAATPEEFVGQVEAALRETDGERTSRVRHEETLLAAHSWDGVVGRMRSLIEDRLVRKPAARA